MANEYLNRTPTSGGNRTTWTLSCWAKISGVTGADLVFFGAYRTGTSQGDDIFFRTGTGGALRFTTYNGTSYEADILDNAYKRDNASWVHVLAVANTTAGTTIDRWHLYVNGVRITDTSNNTYPSANLETNINNLVQHYIGAPTGGDLGQVFDLFFVDGQALTPDVFGFYKEGKGYISAGSTQSTDFRPGQWVPKAPRTIKSEINRKGGFGVNGFYLPMNDSSNFGADFHTTPNSIITLKGEDLPQPRNGAPTTTDAYVSQLRSDPYASNLVLAIPGISGGQDSGYGDYSADIKGSGTNKTIIPGNVSIGITGSYYGSALTGFSTDPATFIQNHEDFRFGSDDFTVEAWIYVTDDTTGTSGILSLYQNTDNRRSWSVLKDSANNGGGIRLITSDDGTFNASYDVDPNVSLPLNQWNHIVAEKEGNTGRVYQNGVCVGINTDLPTTLYSNVNDNILVGAGIATYNGSNGEQFTNGYIQDLRVYKGVAKYKGGFDVPKPYTPVGIGTWRAVPDTTANNFATLNALWRGEYNARTLTNGNLTISHSSDDAMVATVGITTGKWYWETLPSAISGNNNYYGIVGAGATSLRTLSYYYRSGSGTIVRRIDNVATNLQSSLTNASANDVIGIAFNASDKEISWYLNGTQLGTTVTSIASTTKGGSEYFPLVANENSAGGKVNNLNFGQNPTFSENINAGLSTFTDSNGKGLFRYEPPTDFLALCEDNLPTPAIADPGKHFKTVLYRGDNASSHSITGVGFKPDFVWVKRRDGTTAHNLTDSVRGIGRTLFSSNLSGDDTDTNRLQSFDSDGFTAGANGAVNQSGSSLVAWCWKAGAGTTSTNTDGSINSVVSVNQDAGFSIVSYTGTGTNATVGHGLNKTPKFIITKNRDASVNWIIYHGSVGATQYLRFTTNAATTQSSIFNDTEPTSSVFSLGSSTTPNGNGQKQIAYCWTEIEGFSKFGSWNGNGNADGPFVYCGFKPAFILTKRIDSSTNGNWTLFDSSRSSTNPVGTHLRADTSETELNFGTGIDIVSNGFKMREAASALNNASGTYIFAAFAESPFQTANAK